jgi:hypothetical protein
MQRTWLSGDIKPRTQAVTSIFELKDRDHRWLLHVGNGDQKKIGGNGRVNFVVRAHSSSSM